jgi:Cof subfamily protein (haloacid dehalogenase superfamily)
MSSEKPEIKIVLCDMDETFLVDQKVPDFNKEVVEKITKKNVKFVPCTGRTFGQIIPILTELNLKEKENLFTICLNGGLIVENKTSKIIKFNDLEYDLANEIFLFIKDKDFCFDIFTIDTIFIFRDDGIESEVKKKQKVNFKIMKEYNFDLFKNIQIGKIMISKENGRKELEKLKIELEKNFGENLCLFFSKDKYLEVVKKGINKGEALKFLVDYLKIKRENVLAIGDNYNDLEMISLAGIGACVANATEDVKKVSNYVCKNDFKNGGVKEVLEKFILKDE